MGNGFNHGEDGNSKRKPGPRNKSVKSNPNWAWGSIKERNFSSYWYTLREGKEVYIDENGQFAAGRLEIFVDNNIKKRDRTSFISGNRHYKPREFVQLQKSNCKIRGDGFYYEIYEKPHLAGRHTGIWNIKSYNEW